MTDGKLTPKQQRFVEEYLIDLNATQAALRSGYSPDSAKQIGTENLAKPAIQAAIQEAFNARSERTQIDQDWVLKRLALLADANIKRIASWDDGAVEFKDSDDLSDEEAYIISEVALEETIKEGSGGDELVMRRQKKIKHVSDATKKSALELIGKHLGMFKENIQLNGPLGGIPVQVTYKKPDDPS